MKLQAEKVADILRSFVQECDGDTLAALFEYAFDDVESAIMIGDEIEFTKKDAANSYIDQFLNDGSTDDSMENIELEPTNNPYQELIALRNPPPQEESKEKQRLNEILDDLTGKVDKIVMEFDGCGDSGSFNETSFEKEEEIVDPPPLTFEPFHKYHNHPATICLTDALEEIGYTYLPGGWEINEGSYGQLIIDVNARKVKLEFHERYESENYSEQEW